MNRLTELQSRVLNALRQQVEDGNVNFRALASSFGVHPVTLQEHLEAIARKGHIEIVRRGPGRSPTVRLRAGGVPVVGRITGGPLSEAIEHPEGYLRLPGYPGRFALRVQGHSMAEYIQEGDLVLLDKRSPKSGEVCAVRVDGSDATLKYLDLYVDPETVVLRPHNPEYRKLEVKASQVAIDGVFAGLIRGGLVNELFNEELNMT